MAGFSFYNYPLITYFHGTFVNGRSSVVGRSTQAFLNAFHSILTFFFCFILTICTNFLQVFRKFIYWRYHIWRERLSYEDEQSLASYLFSDLDHTAQWGRNSIVIFNISTNKLVTFHHHEAEPGILANLDECLYSQWDSLTYLSTRTQVRSGQKVI